MIFVGYLIFRIRLRPQKRKPAAKIKAGKTTKTCNFQITLIKIMRKADTKKGNIEFFPFLSPDLQLWIKGAKR